MQPNKISELVPPTLAQHSGMDRKLDKKKWPPKKIAILAAIVLFVAFSIYALVGESGARLNVDVNKLTISTISRGPFQEYIPVNGTVQPLQTFYLDAVEGGRVDKKFVEAGAFVRKGDPILKLANTNLQLDVMYREALSYEQINNARNTRITIDQNTIRVQQDLADADFQLQQATRNFRRDSTLFHRGLIADLDFKQSSEQYRYALKRMDISRENARQDSLLRHNQIGQLEESIRRLNSNIDMTRKNLDNLTLRAPISGQLSSLNAEIGQSKAVGERLGQIDVVDSFKVRAAIDEFYISRINPGQTGEFDFNGTSYRLSIAKVFPEVRDGRFEVDMQFQGTAPQSIRRGQTLQIRLELGDLAEATLVPRGGFYQKTGGQWIFVLDKSGTFAVKRPIRLGRQNPQMFEVLDGLTPGEQAVTSSYDTFGDVDKLVLKR